MPRSRTTHSIRKPILRKPPLKRRVGQKGFLEALEDRIVLDSAFLGNLEFFSPSGTFNGGSVAAEVQVGFRNDFKPLFTLPGGVSIDSGNNTASVNSTMEVGGLTFSGALAFSADTAIDRYTVTGGASIEVGGSTISLSLGQPGSNSAGLVLQNGALANLSATVNADFGFKGLSIDVQEVMFSYHNDRFELAGGINVATGDTGSTRFNVGATLGRDAQPGKPGRPGMVIERGEVTEVFIVANGGFSLSKMSLEARNLTIDYSSDEDRLELSGGVDVMFTEKLIARANISDETPFIIDGGKLSIGGDGAMMSGGMKVGPFDASVMLNYQDSPTGLTLTAEAEVELPKSLTIGGTLEIRDGQLSSIGLEYDSGGGTGKPIGSTGFFLTNMAGKLENLDSPEDIVVKGEISARFGKKILGKDLANANGRFTIDANHLEISGNVELMEGLIGRGDGLVDINWSTGVFVIKAELEYADGAVKADGSLRLDRQGNVNFHAGVSVNIPDSLPGIGGKRLGGGDLYVQVRPDNGDDTWVKVFGDVLFWRVGFQFTPSTKEFDLLTGDDEPVFREDQDICPHFSQGGTLLALCTWRRTDVQAGGLGSEQLAYDYRLIRITSPGFQSDSSGQIIVNINGAPGGFQWRSYQFSLDGSGDWDGDGKSDLCSSVTDTDCIIPSDGTDTVFVRLKPVAIHETSNPLNGSVPNGRFEIETVLGGNVSAALSGAAFMTSGHLPEPKLEKPPEATLIDEENSLVKITVEGENAFVDGNVNSIVSLHYIDTKTGATGLIAEVDLGSQQPHVDVVVDHDPTDRMGRFKLETVWDGLPELADWSQRPHDPATQASVRFFALVDNQVNPIVQSPNSSQAFVPPDPSIPDVFRANVGGPALPGGWIADEDLVVYRNVAGQNATYDGLMTSPLFVPAGTPDDLFRTERWDQAGGPEMRYDFPVHNGTYNVRLYFAENYVSRRVFDVEIEGEIVLDRFNILETFDDFGANGMHQGIAITIPVSITDGNLDLDFLHVIENPQVAGIEIIRTYPVDNDNFADAAAIVPDQLVEVEISGATREQGEPFHGAPWNGNPNTVWYQWTAPSAGDVSITALGSDFKTAIGVYTGASVQGLSLVTQDVDENDVAPDVTFTAEAGSTYRIALAGVGPTMSINADLRLTFDPVDAIRSVITTAADPVVIVNGDNDGDGDSGNPPANEGVGNAIDGTTNKYLNFKDLGSGLIVTPSVGATIVDGLRIYTANDGEERDPASYLLEGSNNGPAGPFVTIHQSNLSLPTQRNETGKMIDGTQSHQEVTFPNETSYTTYRLTFPTLRDANAANSLQFGEVEFLGNVAEVPDPNAPVYLINAGGDAVNQWSSDIATKPDGMSDVYATDKPIDFSATVPAGTLMSIFQSERYGPDGAALQWNLPVTPGEYEVNLYFAEIWYTEPGKRTFDVSIEGTQVLNDYDIVDDVGAFTGVVKSFRVTSDGNLDIDFGHVVENPKISGIEVVPLGQPESIDGDINADGSVGFADFLILSGNFGQNVAAGTGGDIDGNGKVEFADFLVLSGNFGKSVGGAEPAPAAAAIDRVWAGDESAAAEDESEDPRDDVFADWIPLSLAR